MRCKARHKRTYGFESCGLEKPIKKYGLCADCFKEWLKTESGQEYVESMVIPKAKKEVKKKEKERFNKMKAATTNNLQKLQKKVQEIVRLIDFNQPCTARPQLTSFKGQGGHVNPKGAHPECRVNLHNIHLQSAQSNKWMNDDDKMKEGLERIYGKEYRLFVEGLANRAIVKHSNDDYGAMYRIACSIANELKRDLKKRDSLDRLMLRNKYNKEIGCYPDRLALFDTIENQIF